MITSEQIKAKLQEALKYSGTSQSEIGRKIGVKPQTVFQYFNGEIMPSLDTFANLCEVLDLDPVEILCLKR